MSQDPKGIGDTSWFQWLDCSSRSFVSFGWGGVHRDMRGILDTTRWTLGQSLYRDPYKWPKIDGLKITGVKISPRNQWSCKVIANPILIFFFWTHICWCGCFQKLGYPKMDGENNGKPYEQLDDLEGKPTIFGNTHFNNIRSHSPLPIPYFPTKKLHYKPSIFGIPLFLETPM